MEPFTWKVFGLPSSHFFQKHEVMLGTLRQLLSQDHLSSLALQLMGHMRRRLSCLLNRDCSPLKVGTFEGTHVPVV